MVVVVVDVFKRQSRDIGMLAYKIAKDYALSSSESAC